MDRSFQTLFCETWIHTESEYMIEMQVAQQNMRGTGTIHRRGQKSVSCIEKHGLIPGRDHIAGGSSAKDCLVIPVCCHRSPGPQHFESQSSVLSAHFRLFSFDDGSYVAASLQYRNKLPRLTETRAGVDFNTVKML